MLIQQTVNVKFFHIRLFLVSVALFAKAKLYVEFWSKLVFMGSYLNFIFS